MADSGAMLEGDQCPHPFIGGPNLDNICASSNTSILYMFNLLLALNPKIGKPCGRVNPVKKPDPSYDFIVVGGGAAGPAVAEYLSRSCEISVLLIEAGPDTPAAIDVPSNLQLFLNTDLDWRYETTNESYACLKRGGKCSWPRGKNLGGCTSHHGMAYHRGHKKDYTRWGEMGVEGWSFEEVLKYFIKAEDNKEIHRVGTKYHGTGGLLPVERFPYVPPFGLSILEAAEETGYGVTEDMVGDKITGFTIAQTLSKDGVRMSSSDMYLEPFKDRPNLSVMLNSTVYKLLMIKNKVVGVKVMNNGKSTIIRAKKEVIVSGGAINSPQLLLLSGIGPKEHLQSVGIRTEHNLPGVGENLHNHVSYGLDFAMNMTEESTFTEENARIYLYNQTGPMSSTGLAQMTGILASKYTTKDDPDIQIFFAGYQATCPTNGRIEDLASYNNLETVRFTSVNLHTESRGRISLKNKNPLTPPVIWSNELSHEKDVDVVVEGIHVLLKLANSSAMQRYGLTLIEKSSPECSQYPKNSDDYWKCMIRWYTRAENHQAGSCKMGRKSDPMAVVDSRLRVHGIEGLRVADASIMPKVVSGNPVATIHMIGLRAGEFIAEDHGIKI